MSEYIKAVNKQLERKFGISNNQEQKQEKNEDKYSKLSDKELNELYNEIHEEESALNKEKAREKEEKELEDIDTYYSPDEQIDLISKGIDLIIAKKYKIETNKHPLRSGNPTNIFKKWLKTNSPDDSEFLEEENLNEIEKAINQVKTEDKEPEGISPHEIQRKIKEYHEKHNAYKKEEIIETSNELKEKVKEYQQEVEEENKKEKKTKGLSLFGDTPRITAEGQTFRNSKIEKKKIIPEETTFSIIKSEKPVIQEEQESLPIKKFDITKFPTESEIKFLIARHRFVLENLLDPNDIITIKQKEFVKKSGWRKFINAFGISIELIEQKVYEQFGEKHAEIRVRAIAPNGQSVEGIGVKSWSELYDKTMHNLIANAWTRAVNRAVSDLVGYGAVSYEELKEGDIV